MAFIVYLLFDFKKAKILFKPFIEFKNKREEIDFYSV